MVEIIVEMSIEQSQESVFELAQDYKLRLDWDPFLEDIKFVSKDKSLDRDLKVWVKAKNGFEMTVRYLNYNSPHHVSMKMIDGPFIFNKFSGVWIFENINDKTTRVIFKYNFTTKWYLRPISPLVKWKMRVDMKERLLSLKEACEEGDLIKQKQEIQ